MDRMVLYAQFVGALATICMVVSFQLNDRRKILFVQILNSICWIVHYTMLGAMSGVVINVVCFFRNLVFRQRGKQKWADFPALPYIVCAIEIGLTVAVWKDPFDALACAGASFQTISMWMKRPRWIRIFSLIASPIWFVYDIHNQSYIGMVTEAIVTTSLIIAIIRYDVRGQAEEQSS